MDVRGQGALEYLLLIGGAVLVAAIVIALITGIPTGAQDPEAAARCASKTIFTECNAESFVTGGYNWTCEARKADGITPAGDQTDMGMCRAVQGAAV